MRVRCAICALGLGLVTGCSAPPPPPEFPPPPPKKKAEGPKLPDRYIDRGQLEMVLREGPSWVLRRVPIEVVLENKKYVGWRIIEMPVEWNDVDLIPGDVIRMVNAMPLETQDDFFAAFTTLGVASELKIAYLREGEARELSLPILGQPSKATSQHLNSIQGEQLPKERPRSRTPKKKPTKVIQGDDRPLSDTLVDWSQ